MANRTAPLKDFTFAAIMLNTKISLTQS